MTQERRDCQIPGVHCVGQGSSQLECWYVLCYAASTFGELANSKDIPLYSQGVYNNETIQLYQFERQILRQFFGKSRLQITEFLEVMFPELAEKHPKLSKLTGGGQNLDRLMDFFEDTYFSNPASLYDDIDAFQFEVQEDGLLLAVDAIYESQEKGGWPTYI